MSEDGEETKYVKLVSAEGHEFFLERDVCASSTTIRTMLEGKFRESQENVINFPEISGYILERVVKYLHYKAQYSHSTTRIPDFTIEPEVALELMIAAKYLDC
jgi:transcription elongation factor B subunit 1